MEPQPREVIAAADRDECVASNLFHFCVRSIYALLKGGAGVLSGKIKA